MTNKAIAEKIGITSEYLNTLIYRARREGWLVFENPMDKLEYEIVPKVVENLNLFLDQRSEKVTIETAKGVLFPVYKDLKGVSEEGPKTMLAFKIEMPPSMDGTPVVSSGIVSGTPRVIVDVEEGEDPSDG